MARLEQHVVAARIHRGHRTAFIKAAIGAVLLHLIGETLLWFD